MTTESSPTESPPASPSSREDAANMMSIAPYCTLRQTEKIWCIVLASLVALLCPLSGNIYFPALEPIARELNASQSTISLTITVFLICQGIAPLLTAPLSERHGRRPVLLFCLTSYTIVNVGLALQTNLPALFALRCLQSVGSSGVSVVAMAVVADLVTRAERGGYMMYSSLGMTVAPILGPVVGGVLTTFLGWRSIFVFLAALATLLALAIAAVMPETCRAVVGNGAIHPQRWNRSCRQILWPLSASYPRLGKESSAQDTAQHGSKGPVRCPPTVWDSFRILRDRSTTLIIVSGMLMQTGYMGIMIAISFLFASKYGFSPLHVGLCYLPYAAGGVAARWTVGTVADRNFKRHAARAGVVIVRNRQTREQLGAVALERARLQITLPFLYASALVVMLFGWLANAKVHVAGILVLLAVLGNTLTGAQSTLNMLLIDKHAERPATANAAQQLFKSFAGAGVAAVILPIMARIGAGWTATLIAGFWMAASLLLWIIYAHGQKWRQVKSSGGGGS